MSLHQLESSALSVTIKSLGAEVSSVKNLQDGTEYMWQADPEVWGRHSPLLFPIVGRLKGDCYTYKGVSYEMGQHGFARNSEFELLTKTSNGAGFRLSSTGETEKIYPFKFVLDVIYMLNGQELEVAYEVNNLQEGEEPLLFSIGGHPAFSCPIVPEELLTDYVVEFSEEEHAHNHYLDAGIRSGETGDVLVGKREIPVTPTLFDRDALVFGSLASTSCRLLSAKSGRSVQMNFEGFPYFGIWAKPNASFVCLEPWQGIADEASHNQELAEKEGIIEWREKNKPFRISYTLIFD
ncbi:MAG: aldose 1-epimerase family protein [Bacteroidota bacterium]